jgi:HEAT repeat protein
MTHAKETYYDPGYMENAFRGIGSPAVDPLVRALKDASLSDSNRKIKARIACALFAIKDPRTVETMVRVVRTQEYGTCAMRGLTDSGDPRAIAALIGVMTDPNDPEDESASSLLFKVGSTAVEPLVAVLQSPDTRPRRLAAKALAQIKDPRAVNALLDALRRRDTAVVAGGYVFFVDYGQPGSEDTLIEALNQYNDEQMAEFMLNCGNSKVEAATRAWGKKHDPQLHQEVYGVLWGARKLQSAH